ncbi:glycosyltransferase family 2 protein [Abyssisolibacter fermentans]|uniref:glycosyltransferase family 2 protein n=1 Tax=Abyssisolibacter fermentans TaxID=1766203 RepID=UPI0008352FB1|nr:glycosyltransferase [Abyssisolibacter fermentans]
MDISIVIPTYNKYKYLEATLKSLEKQNVIDLKYEIIIVDDGSTDETKEIITSCMDKNPNIKYYHQKNQGRSIARNTGIKVSKGKYILFLDDDRIVCEDFVQAHYDCLKQGSNKKIISLGARYNIYRSNFEKKHKEFVDMIDNNTSEFTQKSRLAYYWRKIQKGFENKEIAWITFTTGNVGMSKEFLLQVGSFDERFKGWGLEDTELGYRLFKAGGIFVKNDCAKNYHIEHARNKKVREEDEKRNHELFYDLHKDKQIEYFKKLVRAEIGIDEFIALSKNEIDDIETNERERDIIFNLS